jgi:hypothetical protein
VLFLCRFLTRFEQCELILYCNLQLSELIGRVSLRACASYDQQDVGFHAWEGFQSPEMVSMAVYILDYGIA